MKQSSGAVCRFATSRSPHFIGCSVTRVDGVCGGRGDCHKPCVVCPPTRPAPLPPFALPAQQFAVVWDRGLLAQRHRLPVALRGLATRVKGAVAAAQALWRTARGLTGEARDVVFWKAHVLRRGGPSGRSWVTAPRWQYLSCQTSVQQREIRYVL